MAEGIWTLSSWIRICCMAKLIPDLFSGHQKKRAETTRAKRKMVDFTPAAEEVKNKICFKWKIGLCKCERWLCASTHWINYVLPSRGSSRPTTHTTIHNTHTLRISPWWCHSFHFDFICPSWKNMCFNTDGEYCAANSLSVRHAKQINSVSGETHVERAARMRIWCRSICPIAHWFGHRIRYTAATDHPSVVQWRSIDTRNRGKGKIYLPTKFDINPSTWPNKNDNRWGKSAQCLVICLKIVHFDRPLGILLLRRYPDTHSPTHT